MVYEGLEVVMSVRDMTGEELSNELLNIEDEAQDTWDNYSLGLLRAQRDSVIAEMARRVSEIESERSQAK